jgi:hypothetical protein
MLEVLAKAMRQKKEIKGLPIGKEELKLSFYADGMIIAIEEPKNSPKRLL